jgi:hypothetical protein
MSKATINLSAIATAIGANLGALSKLEKQATALKETINKGIVELHTAKAKVGIYRKDGTGCAIATAFVDGCVSAGLKASTAQNVYLPTFKKAVASGEPVAVWNSKRPKADDNSTKGDSKAKGKGKSELSELLVKAFNHDEGKSFEALCQSVEKGFYTDATFKTIYAGFIDYLESEGYKISQ